LKRHVQQRKRFAILPWNADIKKTKKLKTIVYSR